MDLFHKIIDLIDKNSSVIPEGDYLEMCDTIKELREKVKPPPFLIDQNEPMTILQRWVDVDDEEDDDDIMHDPDVREMVENGEHTCHMFDAPCQACEDDED